MKTLIVTLLFSIFYTLNAQLTITTDYREDGRWNNSKTNWEILSTDSGITVFNFNKELTSFRHITGKISSNYKIINWDYNDDEVLYEMKVRSDAGYEYDLLIDGINAYVIFFYYDETGNYRMVRHSIKDTWYDE